MKNNKVANALTAFAKRWCADWENSEGCWKTGGECRLAQNQPCNYFKTAVFPNCDPKYPYANKEEVKRYPKIHKIYAKIYDLPSDSQEVVRKCSCGTAIGPRQRMCSDCREKKRRKTKRLYQRKFRQSAVVQLT